jgi:hypothetical protein
MKQRTKVILFALEVSIVLFFGSCKEKKTDDPTKTYKFWSGGPPQKDIEVIHGKYWQSAQWSKEYIMYLEVKAPSSWRKQFIKQNNLVEIKESKNVPSDAPSWFSPGKNFRTWVPAAISQGSVYYEDTLTGKLFIYEIQL